MTCKPCLEGEHSKCEKGDCQCHIIEQQITKEIEQETGCDAAMADVVYSNLLYGGGSKLCAMFSENAGRPAVTVFIAQVLRTYKALQC